jgi:maltooligosyltrehalose synthase
MHMEVERRMVRKQEEHQPDFSCVVASFHHSDATRQWQSKGPLSTWSAHDTG